MHKAEFRGRGAPRPRRGSAKPLQSCPTVARQALLPMGFSRQEYWSGLPFPSPRDLPCLLHWQTGSLLLGPSGKPRRGRGVRRWSRRVGGMPGCVLHQRSQEEGLCPGKGQPAAGTPWGGEVFARGHWRWSLGELGRVGWVNGDRSLGTVLIKNLIQEEKRRKAGRLKFLC